jgi:hypothetical protein
MSCHVSCSTCSGTTFTECLTCPAGASLLNGACFCDSEWNATCTYSNNIKNTQKPYPWVLM